MLKASKKVLFLTPLFILTTLTFSGCSQEPAAETLRSGKKDDYRYLSKALQDSATTSGAPATATSDAQAATSATPTPTPSIPEPSPASVSQPSAETPPSSPDPSSPTPTEANGTSDADLKFIKKYDGAIIKTSKGDITIHFYNDDAPKTVNNFLKLADAGFYDGIRFHRVIKGFIVQTGDPNSKDDNWADDGQGGPGYLFDDEINSHKLVEGSVAMANSGPNTNGSQFFIVTAKSAPLLDGKYTNFGEVTDGMDVVGKIEKVDTDENDHPKENIDIESIKLVEKK